MIHKTYFSKTFVIGQLPRRSAVCWGSVWQSSPRPCSSLASRLDGTTSTRHRTRNRYGRIPCIDPVNSWSNETKNLICVQIPIAILPSGKMLSSCWQVPQRRLRAAGLVIIVSNRHLLIISAELLVFRKFPEIWKFWKERQYFRKKK